MHQGCSLLFINVDGKPSRRSLSAYRCSINPNDSACKCIATYGPDRSDQCLDSLGLFLYPSVGEVFADFI